MAAAARSAVSSRASLRYLQIPSDSSLPIAERVVSLDPSGAISGSASGGGVKLSCDAAYFTPLLLKGGPPSLSDNGCAGVIPFPTFNECQRDDVPLFFSRRLEDQKENLRARQLLTMFIEKIGASGRQPTTFYGDVAVFWRRGIDEMRHQMILVDFLKTDALQLLGAQAVEGSKPRADQKQSQQTAAGSSRPQSTSQPQTDSLGPGLPELLQPSPGKADALPGLLLFKRQSPGLGPQPVEVPRPSSPPASPTASRLMAKEALQAEAAFGENVAATFILKRFVEVLDQQLPLVSAAVERLADQGGDRAAISRPVEGGEGATERRVAELSALLIEAGIKERHLSAELFKANTELAQAAAFQSTVVRKQQLAHQELLNAQAQAVAYRDEGARLMQEVTRMQEELLRLRGVECLKPPPEQRGVPQATSAVELPKGGPPSASNGGSRRLLRHSGVAALYGDQSASEKTAASKSADFDRRQYIVAQVYTSGEEEDGLSEQFARLSEGDLVTVEREDESGWWWVSNSATGVSGWYPFSFLKKIA